MICFNCKTELPDEAKFCWNCGNPQKPILQVEEPDWEVCEITCARIEVGRGSKDEWEFRAQVGGSESSVLACDPYVTTVNPHADFEYLSRENNNYIRNVFTSMVRELESSGWEPLDLHGKHWYSYRFRKRVDRSDDD